MNDGLPFDNIDLLIGQFNRSVEWVVSEATESPQWCWVQYFPETDTRLIVHGAGAKGYTKAEAYEDALRDILGLTPIADEAVQ